MKKFILKNLLLFILFLVLNSFSPQEELKTVFLSLQNETYNITDERFFIASIIDLRENKENIGFTKIGTNQYGYVDFRNSFSDVLQKYLNLNIKTGFNRLHIAIDEFYISETSTGNKETGVCEISLYFFLETDNGYILLRRFNGFTEVFGLDVTKKQPKNIGQIFELAFLDLQTTNTKSPYLFKSLENLNENPAFEKVKFNLPIFKEDLKTGIYNTLEDFKNNTPSNDESFFIDTIYKTNKYSKNQAFYVPRFSKNRKKIKNIWGYAINGEPYIFFNKDFLRVYKFKNEFYFYDYYEINNANYGAIGMAGFLFGFVGGIVAASIENKKNEIQKIKHLLNPHNGNIRFKFED